jgi:tetratricopeptide (TPR) repeat protein
LAFAYEQNGQSEEARRIAEAAGLIASPTTEHGAKVIGSDEEIAKANSEDPLVARKALLVLLGKNPRSATLLARLGESYRTEDPAKSLDYYRQASELEPTNHNYVVGYAAALVQERRFADAINLLQRVLAKDPNHYAAHANLATALYAQKNYPAALTEYDWLIKNKPDLVVAYYFIATAHDNLGEYPEALAAYEAFIARANEQSNRLEIEKVKLRLPILKRQIQLGQGNKRKPSTR